MRWSDGIISDFYLSLLFCILLQRSTSVKIQVNIFGRCFERPGSRPGKMQYVVTATSGKYLIFCIHTCSSS